MFSHAAAPVRVGIAGGGTDLPAWTAERVGRCLSLAVKAYTHAVAIHRPDGQVVAAYRNRDTAASATEIANGLIRESALLHGWEDSFEVHTLSELSSFGSGLGVSSSIAVSLAACFSRLGALREGRPLNGDFLNTMLRDSPLRAKTTTDGTRAWEPDPAAYLKIARDAWTVEIDRLKRPIGRQDHMAAAHGGLRLYRFEKDEAAVERTFEPADAAWVAKHLYLVRLPEGHDSRAILSSVKSTSVLDYAAQAVKMAVQAIEERDVDLLGAALACGQESKNKIAGATPAWVRALLDKIDQASDGILGCKVAGAGGGGHVLVACNDDSMRELLERVTALPVVAIEADLEGVKSEGWA